MREDPLPPIRPEVSWDVTARQLTGSFESARTARERFGKR